MIEVSYKQIGVIHSPYKAQKGTPIQPRGGENVKGTVEVFPQYKEGLAGLEGFSHVILLYHFHLAKQVSLKVTPFLDQDEQGIFATRAPVRPNPIGISIVRLLKIEDNRLFIQDMDIVDGTPLLDIKPFIVEFGPKGTIKQGWYTKHIGSVTRARADQRFISKTNE
ncbi:MAG TPA: tRNA (N6-threonylcarbamoyladenosine(37)-N6)-methyltransferase TrmO [Anaerolineae bacterium]|nr:tRNA (N6-threonylcarbamoyladenosine(37)-N6)-methyltransferase TrmO [Anaerolineae bacterium]